MKIKNADEIDEFLFLHKENICSGVKNGLLDEEGLLVNTSWRDSVTGEEIMIEYECDHGKGLNDYCLECGRIHST